MDLAPLVRAVEVLMSPQEWGSRDAWLAECLRRVRDARGAPGPDPPADAVSELEALLHLPGDEPGWLHAAFESLDAECWDGGALPAITGGSEALVPVVSLRCALLAGLATLDRLPALPTTRELRITFGLRGREPQIALLAAEGLSNAAIAQRPPAERAHGPALPRARARPARSPYPEGAGPAPHGRQRRALRSRRIARRASRASGADVESPALARLG